MNFYGEDQSEPVATMFVKEKDITETEEARFNEIIYDPGVGEVLTDGKLFRGWSIENPDYDENTEALDIEDIRTEIKRILNEGITEGDELNIYAMIFKHVTISYIGEEEDITVGTDNILIPLNSDISSGKEYTVNMAYTPAEDTQNFEGWNVSSGAENIIGHTSGDKYKNSQTIRVTGDVTFSVYAPYGHWLIFNENGRGATYNAAQFVETDEVTSDAELLEMVRTGYTFKGWYTEQYGDDEAPDESKKFTFGSTLDRNTTIYAKWEAIQSANYTVIIWKQNVSGDGYDFGEAITLSGTTNTVINTVTQQGTGDSAYARVNGQNKTYEGFYLNEFDQNVIIKPEGDSVLNIYYDRIQYTLRFFYARSYDITTGGTTYYEYTRVATTNRNGVIAWQPGYSYDSNETYYRNEDGDPAYYKTSNDGWFSTSRTSNNTWYRINNGTIYTREEVTSGGTTHTYIQVNCNNEGFLQGRAHNRNLNQSLTYRGSNDYQLLDGSNTWKDVNNSTINGNAQNLISADYLNKPEVTPGTLQINNVTTDVVTGANSSTVQSVNMTYYYYDVVVRYEQDLNDLWPVPNAVSSSQTMTSYNRSNSGYTTIRPLLQGSWAKANNIGGKYATMDTGVFVGTDKTAYFLTYWRYENYHEYQYNVYFSALETETTGGTTYKGNRYILQNDKSYIVANGQGWKNTGAPTDSGAGYYDVSSVSFDGTTIAGRVDNQSTSTINVYYDRIQKSIEYWDGTYVDGNGNKLDVVSTGLIKTEENIAYGENLSAYNKGGASYYTPPAPEGFIFEGWYGDSEGIHPITFTTMPKEDIKVYAKWRQIEYRVFLHANTTDTALEWGSDDQEMSFRRPYGSKLSTPTGTRGQTYVMVGWYRNEACTDLFSKDGFIFNDTNVTTPYDKTVDMTDPMDKFGNITGTGYNTDMTGYGGTERYWITRKLDLYAKWRQVIIGADGIGIYYDAGDGTNAPDDTNKYLDQASAIAQAASVPTDSNKVFLHWVVQKYNKQTQQFEDTEETVYPGDNFTVQLDYAKAVENPGSTPEDPSFTYTVHLRAEYVPKEVPTPTHITWYPNYEGSTDDPIEDTGLQINEPVEIRGENTFEREGYIFVGWAREPEYNAGGQIVPVYEDADAWLVYDVVNDQFKEGNNVVTHIAADEKLDYHGMYAVWEKIPLLTITKEIDGNKKFVSIPENGFDITVTLDANATEAQTAAFKKYNDVTTTSITLSLAEDESDSVKLLAGTKVTITEADYSDNGFVGEPTISQPEVPIGDDDVEVTVTNHAPNITPTGLDLDTTAAKTALLSLFAFAMMCVLGFSLKRRYAFRR